ncbi:MAG: alpha/beta fold hydrolase [Planctomycetota bacterium]
MTQRTLDIDGQLVHVHLEGTGHPVLLVHGFPLDHTMWRHQIDALSRYGQVIAPDLPGFGVSGPISSPRTMAEFADDLADILVALQISEPVVLGGLSMGGYIAWEFWHRHPDRLRAMMICDSRAVADDAITQKARQVAASQALAEGTRVVTVPMRDRLFREGFRDRHPIEFERIQTVMDQTRPETIAAALQGMASRRDFVHRLPEITLPILVLCGEHDVISPAAEMQDLATRLPDAEFALIAGAGHMAPVEQPQAVNEAMQEFLAGVT